MKENYTHITVILDRTGSMEPIRDDTIGGINRFVKDQKKLPGTATLTLVQFDTQDPFEIIHDLKPIDEVPDLTRETFVPRGGTPLYDALGRGIIDTDACLHRMPEHERPQNVVFAIVSDGQENSSKEFGKDQIVAMIKEKTEKAGWQFEFLAQDLNAFADAKTLGINAVFFFEKTAQGTEDAYAALSEHTTSYRQVRRGRGKPKIGFAPQSS